MAEKTRDGGIWETVKTVLYAIIIAMVVRTFAYEPFNIPSGSMIPTLLIGDYLFVSKFSYGYSRYSFPLGAGLYRGRIWAAPPKRGDVAVFKLPRDNETDYIKRIVGLPGDRLQVRAGVLHINGKPVERVRIEDYVYDDRAGNRSRVQQYRETLPNGVTYRVLDSDPSGGLDNTGVYEVPPEHYFAMGDNRDNSSDSRVLNMVGYIPFDNLVGRAEILFFSTDGSARLWEPWQWPFATRFGRFGTLL
ncbi:MAG: signal peptidase I [Alphaproteobacteria bacterium]|jgi:signal peptidase I|nr:signal peptidase I [Alphaproteobacteria bacterium]MDP6515248.1 signal peptidase I [Alphaproteobacteria bacterium]